MNDYQKLFLIFFVFLTLQLSFIFYHDHYLVSDDYTYFYASKLLAEGKLPYRDFFISHPPLQFMIYSFLIRIFGEELMLANIIPLLAIMVSAFMAYKITNKVYATALLLAIFPILHCASIGFGLNLAVMFVLLSIYFVEEKPLLAGILMGLAVFTRLHIAPFAIAMLFYKNRPSKNSKYIVGLSIMAVVFLFMVISIPQSINNIIFYHALKDWRYWEGMRYFVVGVGLLGITISYRTRWFWFIALYFAFLMSLKSVFAYYLIPLSAIIALALAEQDFTKWRIALATSLILGLSLGATILSTTDVMENKAEIESITTAVGFQEGELCGNNEILPLIALKTNKRIKDNEIDTNFQRRKALDCTGAITVYRFREFVDCQIIKKEKRYSVGLC
jgi:hypothetical protein